MSDDQARDARSLIERMDALDRDAADARSLIERMDALDRDAADARFLFERLHALDRHAKRDIDAVEDAHSRAILALLRTRTPGPFTLALVAGELERLWWPQAYRKRRRQDRDIARLWFADDLIRHLAVRYRKGGAADPRTQAEQDAAEVLGLSVEGLRKARYRKRRTGRRGCAEEGA
jgi:hypothetical protein